MANELVSCPSCGKPVVVPKMDKGELEQVISKVFSGSSFCQQFPALCREVSQLKQAMGSHPKPSREFIRTQWEDCPECQLEWNRIKKDIQNEALKSHHPVLGPELMNHFASCPECRPEAEKLGIPLPEVEGKEQEPEESFPWVQEEV